MNRLFLIVCGAATLSTAALAQTTIQQDFEAAAKLDQGSDAAAALAAWVRLEGRTARNKRSHAIVLVRKSASLLALDRKDEAVAAARAGLADLPVADASLKGDRREAHFNLGRIARASLDYATAADEFAQADVLAETGADHYAALYGLIDTQTFVDADGAMRSLARLDALVLSLTMDPKVTARYRQMRARLLMNRGDFMGAVGEAKVAVTLLGGLGRRIDLYDVAARSDVAIAALLAGRGEVAREYLAGTGAGRLPDGSFSPGIQMRAPDCGGEADLKPADVAVIEFDINDDGTVTDSTPIYAAGGGRVALEFARVSRNWSWTAEQLKDLPPFFRHGARVEMRCSNTFERPSLTSYMLTATDEWLARRGAPPITDRRVGEAARLPGDRAAVAAADKGGRPEMQVAALGTLAQNGVLADIERGQAAARALTLLRANGASLTAQLAFDITFRASAFSEQGAKTARRLYRVMLAEPAYAADPVARSLIRLMLADAEAPRNPDAARTLLRQVGGEPSLPAQESVKVGALIRLASLEQSKGDPAAARSAFDRSGLTANQCSVIDAPPRLLSAGGSFPSEAREWGFEGWTQLEFDVSADGHVLNERATLSYPPFVFTKAGTSGIAKARYSKSFRPDGGLGCGSNVQRYRFKLG